jgi:NAD(P)-dependent dehydrogenase (short-subunit alcohol dehydrogenase family)
VFSRNSSEIENICATARLKGEIVGYQCDLAEEDQVEQLCQQLRNRDPYWGFIHCAGVTYDSLAAMVDIANGKKLMQINYWSFVQLTKALIRPMARNGGGRLLAVSSVASIQGSKGNGLYSASKAALSAYVRVIASEFSKKGILANSIAPGYIKTDMLAPYANQLEDIAAGVPLNRIGTVNDVAKLVAFLMSEDSSNINAQCITIDGGLTNCR